jgi:hypothetical protein
MSGAYEKAVAAIDTFLQRGVEEAMNQHNAAS